MTDMSELAKWMLDWEQKKRELDELTALISGAVLEHGETVTVGNVRATYSKGRRELDYRAPVESAALTDQIVEALIDKFTETIEGHWVPTETKTNWIAAAKEAGIDPVELKPGTPGVKVKVKP